MIANIIRWMNKWLQGKTAPKYLSGRRK